MSAVAALRLMIKPDHLRLSASLVLNFLARAPGIVATFVILPLASRSLGTEAYGEMLAAFAVGSAFTLPFGAVNSVGRRLLAVAFGDNDRSRQADVFMTTTFMMSCLAAGLALIMTGATFHSWTRQVFMLMGLLPVLCAYFNTFDNLRASYNEHYVTALFQFLFQSTIYAAVYFIGLPSGNVLTAGLALQSPYLLASIATLVFLLIKRPFLISGQIVGARTMFIPTMAVILGDGAIAIISNGTIYWLQVSDQAAMAAWTGTFTRLFQSFVSPVVLILFPLTTFISSRWRRMTAKWQRLVHKAMLLIGVGYGAIVAIVMSVAGPWYIDEQFSLGVRGDRLDVIALSSFMGMVVALKSYTMLLCAVSEARFISFGTATIAAGACALAAATSFYLPPMRALDVLFASMSAGILALLCIDYWRGERAYR